MERTANPRRTILVGAVLLGLTLAAYWPVRECDFVQFDDPHYVTENARVLPGLTWEGLRWSFRAGVGGNWHPLTWLSHMADCQLYGLRPSGHHFTNLVLHGANTVLLLVLLVRLTGAMWPSALVAGLFGLHPLHVESVAWIAERKDVLSTLFFLLTLMAYAQYARRRDGAAIAPGRARVPVGAMVYYVLAALWFACGLMSKPMLVTVPALLCLLDVWPLKRVSLPLRSTPPTVLRRLLWEKIPLFVLSGAVCVITLRYQREAGAVTALDTLPLGFRIANAVVSYVRYLGLAFWPSGLAVFYPATRWPLAWVLGGACLLILVSVVAVVQWRRRPWVGVGWLWYLGTMVPVIGVVQVGQQAMADRYTYIPLIGIFVVLAWWGGELVSRPICKFLVPAVAAAALVACGICARRQIQYWRDNVSLFQRALVVTRDNYVAHNNLGVSLLKRGDAAEAQTQFEAAVHLKPQYADALENLGLCRAQAGGLEEAAQLLAQAAQIRNTASVNYNLGNVFSKQRRWPDAEAKYEAALALQPDFPQALYNLAIVKAQEGKPEEAARDYRAALELRQDYLEARLGYGAFLVGQGKFDEGIEQFALAVRAAPENPDAQYNLAAAFASAGKWTEAEAHYEEACRLRPADLEARFGWGLALLNGGKLEPAAERFAELLAARADGRAHYYAGLACDGMGRDEEALKHYREALRLSPGTPLYENDLAWMLATNPHEGIRNGAQAVQLAEEACRLTGGKEARFWGTLDAAYAEAGRYADAIAAATRARELAATAGQTQVVQAAEQRLQLYRDQKPYRSELRQ